MDRQCGLTPLVIVQLEEKDAATHGVPDSILAAGSCGSNRRRRRLLRLRLRRCSGDDCELPGSPFAKIKVQSGEKNSGPTERQGVRGSGGPRRRRQPPKLVNGGGGGRSVLGWKLGSLAEELGVSGEKECGAVGYLSPKFGSKRFRNRSESRDFSGAVRYREELVFFLESVPS